MRAKFGVIEETQVIRLPAKFGLDQFRPILSTSGGKKTNFAVLDFDIL